MDFVSSITTRLTAMGGGAVDSVENAITAANDYEQGVIAAVHADAKAAYDSTAGAVGQAVATTEHWTKMLFVLIAVLGVGYLLAQINLLRGQQ